ncbi:hypothetical protein [Rhizobacter sp. Root1221]|uniref:hypothetical protein n=1 Tax=Rhizobacter sp. Root1221 TaxID=1736433 RepID=UPI000A78FEA0|nr:hypothetical protein [Rhizobacter sp. Root1221]
MSLAWWVSACSAAGLGMIVGGVAAWQVCARRAEQRRRKFVAATRQQYATGTQGLRATNVRLQTALDQEKLAIQTRLSASAAEHRAALSRMEVQLQFAYAEIDRLQAPGRPGALAEGGDVHGFALTRPFPR